MVRAMDGLVHEAETLSMCSLMAGGRMFGIDTRSVREVLGRRSLQCVPLAPRFIGGIVAYRGEVLTTVSLRSLLGMKAAEEDSCVLVLDGDAEGERFGLMVDDVGGVTTVEHAMHAPNPSTLDASSQWLFGGAYRLPAGLLVQLDPVCLRPGSLVNTGLFGAKSKTEETRCER